MIPKILHQVWLGDSPIPEKYIKWKEEWRMLHPNWEYVLWTEKNAPSEAREFMALNNVLACKASVLRSFVVMKYGGMYVDTDCEWNKNVDSLMESNKAFVGRVPAGHIGNAVFAAEPGHETFIWMWKEIPNNAPKPPPWGPKLITEAVDKNPKNVTIFPKEYFFPRDWREKYQPAKNYPNSYLVHQADATWHKKKKL